MIFPTADFFTITNKCNSIKFEFKLFDEDVFDFWENHNENFAVVI